MNSGDTMTIREVLDIRLSGRALITVVLLVAVLGVLLGLVEHHYCTTAPSEVSRPDFGTPRYNWCRSHEGTYRWALAVVPPALVALIGLASRLRLIVTLGVATVVLLASLWVATYPSRLDYAPLVDTLLAT